MDVRIIHKALPGRVPVVRILPPLHGDAAPGPEKLMLAGAAGARKLKQCVVECWDDHLMSLIVSNYPSWSLQRHVS